MFLTSNVKFQIRPYKGGSFFYILALDCLCIGFGKVAKNPIQLLHFRLKKLNDEDNEEKKMIKINLHMADFSIASSQELH